MSTAINVVLATLILGSVDAAIAMGFVYIFRATGLVNFAHGEFMALAAWLAVSALDQHVPVEAAVLLGCIGGAICAAICYRIVISRVEAHGLFVAVVATLGLASVLDGIFPIVWGNAPRPLNFLPLGVVRITAGAGIDTASIAIIVGGAVLYLLVLVIDRRLTVGLQMRAAAGNRVLASQLGISVKRVYIIAWAAAGLLAGVAGVALADTTLISSNLATAGLGALPAALIGGFDSIKGAYPGAMVVALVSTVATVFWRSDASMAVSYMLLLLVLLVRPSGMFGSRLVQRV